MPKPRIRTLKPEFWDDYKIAMLCRDARLLFVGLITMADDLGVGKADKYMIRRNLYPRDEMQFKQITGWLNDLQQQEFIRLFSYKQEEFYYLTNFLKHQKIDRPNHVDVFVPTDDLFALLGVKVPVKAQKITFDDASPTGEGIGIGKGNGEGKGECAAAPPTLEEVIEFFKEKNFSEEEARRAFEYHQEGGWRGEKNSPPRTWKQRMITWQSNVKPKNNGTSKTNTQPAGGRLAPTSAPPSTGGYGSF